MNLKQESRALKAKALTSLISAVERFNSPDDRGRATGVLLHLQHSFEMLLKAALVQTGENIFDKKTRRSVGFKKCLGLASASPVIKLAAADAGALRVIDALRDDEQHWFNVVSEQLLYLHVRAGVTLFDELLQRVFANCLADHLPHRVLPVSVDPPRDLTLVLDEEYSQIAALLHPGRRARHEARARIRTLLAMEAHTDPETEVSEANVNRVERRIKNGEARARVLPHLEDVATTIDGSGVTITVHFSKKQDGAPVRFVADGSEPAAVIREVDLQKRFHRLPGELAQALGLSIPRSLALRRHLGIDGDASCCHEFTRGRTRWLGFSDNAWTRMRDALKTVDMAAIWSAHGSSPRGRSTPCADVTCHGSKGSSLIGTEDTEYFPR